MCRQTAAGAEGVRPLCAASRLHIVWSRQTTGAQAPGAPGFPKGGKCDPSGWPPFNGLCLFPLSFHTTEARLLPCASSHWASVKSVCFSREGSSRVRLINSVNFSTFRLLP